MNFENLPNPEKEESAYLEALRIAIEDGTPYVDSSNMYDREYIEALTREFGTAEEEWLKL